MTPAGGQAEGRAGTRAVWLLEDLTRVEDSRATFRGSPEAADFGLWEKSWGTLERELISSNKVAGDLSS